jgi:hypothetical protein
MDSRLDDDTWQSVATASGGTMIRLRPPTSTMSWYEFMPLVTRLLIFIVLLLVLIFSAIVVATVYLILFVHHAL